MRVFRMQSDKLWIEGAYETVELAVKGLADQLLEAQPLKYPQVCRKVVLKVKFHASWEDVFTLKIFPFKREHYVINEFKYEVV